MPLWRRRQDLEDPLHQAEGQLLGTTLQSVGPGPDPWWVGVKNGQNGQNHWIIWISLILHAEMHEKRATSERANAASFSDLSHLSHLSQLSQLRLVSISLLGFFISVVAVPLLRLTVGSSMGAWCGHFRGEGRVSGGWTCAESPLPL